MSAGRRVEALLLTLGDQHTTRAGDKLLSLCVTCHCTCQRYVAAPTVVAFGGSSYQEHTMSKLFHSPIKRKGRRPTNAWTSEQARAMNAKRWKSVREEREKLFKEMSTVSDDVLEGVVNAYAVMPEGMSSVSPKQANVALQALRHKQSRQLMGKVDPTMLLNRLVDID